MPGDVRGAQYACMKFDGPRLSDGSRMGFFLGDGAGVGKASGAPLHLCVTLKLFEHP